MKILISCLFLLFTLAGASAQSISQKLDSLLVAYADLNHFNGSIVITKSGKKIFERSYGFRDIRQHSMNNGTEVYQLGSLTKSFTAVMIMKLIEQGKLNLNTPVTDFFPDLHPEKRIVISQLLSHTSGLREVLSNATFRQKIAEGLKTNHQELLAYFSSQPLDFDPGTEFSYSNSGYDLLGMIIEKVTGLSYGRAVGKMVLKPLRMGNSGYGYAALDGRKKTVGYDYISKSRAVVAKNWDESWTYASGGLYSTTADLLRFGQGLKNNRIISAKSLAEMSKVVKDDYGYGWFIDTLQGKEVVYHAGNLEGATSYFGRIPADDICIVMLNNQTSTVIESIASKIIAVLNGRPYTLPVAKRAIDLDKNILQRYVGSYDISEDYRTEVQFISGGLYLTTRNMPPVGIFPETENRFFVLDSHMSVTFKVNREGKLYMVIKDGLATKIGDLKEK